MVLHSAIGRLLFHEKRIWQSSDTRRSTSLLIAFRGAVLPLARHGRGIPAKPALAAALELGNVNIPVLINRTKYTLMLRVKTYLALYLVRPRP
jgi:hypothetical protein